MRIIGIYNFYSETGVVLHSHEKQLEFLLEELEYLAIVVNGEITDHSKEILAKYANRIIIRENTGYDAGAYKEALFEQEIRREIDCADLLIFCNCSFYGPFISLKEILKKAQKNDWDFWGIADYDSENKWLNFVQSYFLVFSKKIIVGQVLYDYFEKNICPQKMDWWEACVLFENGLFHMLKKKGYKYGAYVMEPKYNVYTNPYGHIAIDGVPILKRKCFSAEYFNYSLMQASIEYINKTYSYDTNDIVDEMNEHKERLYLGEKIDESILVNQFDRYKKREVIERFIDSYEKVYIWGTGVHAKRLFDFFFFYPNNDKLAGFIISDDQEKVNQIYDYPIYRWSEIPSKDVPIIIAATYNTTNILLNTVIRRTKDILTLWE